MKNITQLDLFTTPTAPKQPFKIERDRHYGIWQTRYGKTPYGWEGYAEFEHLHGAHIATEAAAIAAAEQSIKSYLAQR